MTAVQGISRRLTRGLWVLRHRADFRDRDLARPPRLLVDVSVIVRHDAQTGIQRVVRAVWLQLQQFSGRELEIVPVFASHSHGYCYAPSDFLSGAGTVSPKVPVGARWGDMFLGLDLSAHLLPKYEAQIRTWKAHGASIHLVVYDLLPMTNPQWFNPSTRRNLAKWLGLLDRHADQALCISHHVGDELRGWLDREGRRSHAAPRVGLIRLGGDIAASGPTIGMCLAARAALENTRSHATVLMVGTVEPRKGYDVALRAFEHLWQTGGEEAPHLVIVGRPGWKTTELQQRMRDHPERGRRFHWLENVSDEALEQLYGNCRAVLVASNGEGYGLPVVEAARHRRPVLVRDIPVFREHRFPNVMYLDDDRPVPFAEQLMALVSDPVADAAAAMEAQPPTWADCTRDLLREIGAPIAQAREAAAKLALS